VPVIEDSIDRKGDRIGGSLWVIAGDWLGLEKYANRALKWFETYIIIHDLRFESCSHRGDLDAEA